jgi:hypothetical protein
MVSAGSRVTKENHHGQCAVALETLGQIFLGHASGLEVAAKVLTGQQRYIRLAKGARCIGRHTAQAQLRIGRA